MRGVRKNGVGVALTVGFVLLPDGKWRVVGLPDFQWDDLDEITPEACEFLKARFVIKAGDKVSHKHRRRVWTGTVDEVYENKCTVVWDATGCATDDVPLSKLTKVIDK